HGGQLLFGRHGVRLNHGGRGGHGEILEAADFAGPALFREREGDLGGLAPSEERADQNGSSWRVSPSGPEEEPSSTMLGSSSSAPAVAPPAGSSFQALRLTK